MGFFSAIKGPTEAVLRELFSDPDLAKKVIYWRFKGQDFNQESKQNEESYDQFPFMALRLKHNKESVSVSQTDVEVGDILFMVQGIDAPADMSLKDYIVDHLGHRYQLKGFDDIFGIAVSVSVQGS